jgi:hypothetical protein
MTRNRVARSSLTRVVAAAAAVTLAISPATATVTSCPQTSSPAAWAGSFLDTDTTKNGIVYDSGGARLQLQNGAGQFRSQSLGISDFTVYAAVGDFDHDGWDDFAGAGETDSFLRIYRNRTFDNPAPDWNDVNATRVPSFPVVRELIGSSATSVRRRPIAVGDFNGDGWADVFLGEHRLAESGTLKFMPNNAKLWLNQASNDGDGNPQFAGSYNAMTDSTSLTALGEQAWGGSTTQVLDFNGDRKLDLLYSSSDNGGTIRVFLNNCTLASPQPTPVPAAPAPLACSNSPTFTYASVLITSMGLGGSGTARSPVFSYTDVDGDGFRDLIASAPACCDNAGDRLRLWKGQSGGGLASTTQSITFEGGGTAVFVHDFSGDGKPDLVVGTDNNNYNAGHGGDLFYWVNNGTATPFADASTQLTAHNATTLIDYDVGFLFNYDHDPSNTMDVMIADGNHTGSFFVQANRVAASYVECGDAASGTIDLGSLATSELVVTAARIHPTYTLNGGSIRFYLSNETPENWVLATACPDASGDLCASFPHPVGRTVKWKVEMCSNASHTQTPVLSNVSATFDYTRAREHFRAGVVVNDGVAYLGGFRQPGDRGHLFAVNAGLSRPTGTPRPAINNANDSARNIYSSNPAGTARIDFPPTTPPRCGHARRWPATTQAKAVIDWVRSKRFGVGNDGIEKSRVGAIQNSTPAILTKPGFPIWYVYAGAADKLAHQTYQTAQRDRRNLVLFGSKDGMIHAIQTAPTTMTTTPSGAEAWAFVPPRVASGMIADYTTSLVNGTTEVASFPDGSPTLADYRKADGSFGTAALVGSGAGGKSLLALDVTEHRHHQRRGRRADAAVDHRAGRGRRRPGLRQAGGGPRADRRRREVHRHRRHRHRQREPDRAVHQGPGGRGLRGADRAPAVEVPGAVRGHQRRRDLRDRRRPRARRAQLQRLRRPRGVRRRLRLRLQGRPGPRPRRRLERQHRPRRARGRRRGDLAPRRQHHHDRSVRAVLDPPHQPRARRRQPDRRHAGDPLGRQHPRGAVLRHRRPREPPGDAAQRVLRGLRRHRPDPLEDGRLLHRQHVREVLRRRGGHHPAGDLHPHHRPGGRHDQLRHRVDQGRRGGARGRRRRGLHRRLHSEHRVGGHGRALRRRRRAVLRDPGRRRVAHRHAALARRRRRLGRARGQPVRPGQRVVDHRHRRLEQPADLARVAAGILSRSP